MYRIKLSPYAKLFYTEWLLDPDSGCYNITIDQILYGDLDIKRLNSAFVRYVSEHLLLNSHIQIANGEPYWVPNNTINELEYIKTPLSDIELLNYVKCGFDLYNKPLYRIKLIRIKKGVYRLILVFHHLIIDATSADKGLFAMLPKYYNDIHYGFEYSVEQQIKLLTDLTDRLSSQLYQNKNRYRKFWQNVLIDAEDVDIRFLKLDNNVKNSKTNNSYIGEIRFGYTQAELVGLKRIQRQYKITPYIYGQCIFALLLNKYTNQKHFGISYPVAIRKGMNFLYGAHVNTNIISFHLEYVITIVDLFNQSRRFFKSLKEKNIDYSLYPVSDIIQASNKRLLNTVFVQTYFKDKKFAFEGITKVEIQNEYNVDSISPLSFTDWLSPLLFEQESRENQLNYRVRYDKRELNEELLSNFVASYQKMFLKVLEDLLQGHEKNISDYKILNHKQYLQMVYNWNRTKKNYLLTKTIQELFVEQVARTPNKVAVVYEQTKLTYLELHQRTDRLANYLRNVHKIKPQELVALYLERSEFVVIAILAILKIGGVYVPLDPNDPADRISHILNDSQVKYVLTNENYLSQLKSIARRRLKRKTIVMLVVDSKQLQSEIERQSSTSPVAVVSSDDLAYIIYTSGTTGKPNGVMIEHKGVVNLYYALTSKYFHKGEEEVILQFASYVFDASVEQIILALLNGYVLLLMPNKLWLDPKKCNTYLINNNVTHIHTTPAFLEKISFNGIKTLKRIISGGDTLHIDLYKQLKNTNDNISVINEYGPTETTVTCIINVGNTHHIGKPIANMQSYVLDNDLNPLPVGAIGELYIGGVGLARGYINDTYLTSERFIVNPFQNTEERESNTNARLYKTGDKVRWLPSGELEYIDRNDSQIKIRGYRISLMDIEVAVRSYPGIKHAIVMSKEFTGIDDLSTGNKYLVCYHVSTLRSGKQNNRHYIAGWQDTYQKIYQDLNSKLFKENFLGLNSSYTGLPIAKKHMLEWLNNTVNKIKRLQPKNILELGSGSGLMLFNIVDFCKCYYATDFVSNAVNYLQQGVEACNLNNKVKLFICAADDVPYRQITHAIDTVIVNSVIQCFPNMTYLVNSIRTLICKFPELSHIFLGDIRNYDLLDLFHYSVVLYKNGHISKREIEYYKQRDKELLISPMYFLCLAKSLSQIANVEILAKDCEFENELSKFRYDVVINLDNKNKVDKKGIDYPRFLLVDDLKQYINDNSDKDNIFIKYPNKLVAKDYKQYFGFFNPNRIADGRGGYEELLSIGQIKELGLKYQFNIKLYLDVYDGTYLNIMFCKFSENIDALIIKYDVDTLHQDKLFNNPGIIAKMLNTDLSDKIIQYLNRKLPSYMIPDVLINLEEIPLTVNGKLDQSALPQPEFLAFDNYVAPRNEVEEKICEFYAAVLVLPRKYIGVNHDFFKTGGNSILATQLAVNMQEYFKISVSDIFVLKTPARIAQSVVFAKNNLRKKFEQIRLQYQELEVKLDSSKKEKQLKSHEDYIEVTQQLVIKKQSKNLSNILLTGATGHLGCNILCQLLLRTSYKIYLLVRANSYIEAYARIKDKFGYYFDDDLDRFKDRIVVMATHLERDKIGLNAKKYQELVSNIDSVIHAAALVKHYGDYGQFYKANVQATINLLELAKLTKNKDFHYISTIGIFYDGYIPDVNYYIFNEFDDADSLVGCSNVYVKTKHEGELVVRKYRSYGIKCNIYRLGNVAMHSVNQRHQTNIEDNAFFTKIKTILNLRKIAKEIANVEISPVDYVALAIVKIFDQVELSNQFYHIFNPRPCNLVELLGAIPKLDIQLVTIDEFINYILEKLNDKELRKQLELFMLHQSWLNEATGRTTKVEIAHNRTEYILAAYGFSWPFINKEMLSRVIRQASV